MLYPKHIHDWNKGYIIIIIIIIIIINVVYVVTKISTIKYSGVQIYIVSLGPKLLTALWSRTTPKLYCTHNGNSPIDQ